MFKLRRLTVQCTYSILICISRKSAYRISILSLQQYVSFFLDHGTNPQNHGIDSFFNHFQVFVPGFHESLICVSFWLGGLFWLLHGHQKRKRGGSCEQRGPELLKHSSHILGAGIKTHTLTMPKMLTNCPLEPNKAFVKVPKSDS